MSWKKIDASKFACTKVTGDARAPRTRLWLLPLLVLFLWKKRAVLQVSTLDALPGYRVGYRPSSGPARVGSRTIYDKRFAVRIGREDCEFFAIGPTGHEIPLKIVQEVDKTDLDPRLILI
jgi:hypothetical protein